MAKTDWTTMFQVVDPNGMNVKECCEAIKNSSLSVKDKTFMLGFMEDVAIEILRPMLPLEE